MTISELKAKGNIDVKDDIEFCTHLEVMRLFGADRVRPRIAFHEHPHEPGVFVWLPAFYQGEDNDWSNTKSADFGKVFEERKFDNEDYLEDLRESPERHTRILFAKESPTGKTSYRFKGIYKFDPDLSTKKAVYIRIATTAKLYSSG